MNYLIYPPDYPPDVDTAAFELENAVQTLEIQSRNTALQLAHTRRIEGQNEILNQSRLCGSKPFRMTLDQIGPRQTPALSMLGTACFTAGGRGYLGSERRALAFHFPSETNALTGLFTAAIRGYLGTLNFPTEGYLAGGAGYIMYDLIEEVSFYKPTIAVIGARLSQALSAACGFGNKTEGFFAGGLGAGWYSAYRKVDVFNHDAKTITDLGDKLVTPRGAPHNGAANTVQGWVFGGGAEMTGAFYAAYKTIETMPFASRTFSLVAQSMAEAQFSHACFASKLKAYIAGGVNSVAGVVDNYTDLITAFVFSSQTNAPLSAKIPTAEKVCCDGTGSSLAGFILGGDTPTSNWSGTTLIDKLTYASETSSIPGMELLQSVADQGASADYSPSWS